MKTLSAYYAEFEQELARRDTDLADAFRRYSAGHAPREVFLWLENLRTAGSLPQSLESVLTDFYWEML